MAIIGTSTAPGFYEEKAARAGAMIQALLAQQQRRQQQQQDREDQQIKFFLAAVDKDPGIANAMGPDMVSKFGDKYPIIPAVVSAMQNRQKMVGDMDEAANAFTSKMDDLSNSYQQMQQHVASMPDSAPVTIPNLMGGAGGGMQVQMPNPDKVKAHGVLSQMNPMMFPVTARMALPAKQQMLVGMNPSLSQFFPKGMPSLEDIPQEQRPIILGQMGAISPESVEAAKMHIGMISKPADLQKQQETRSLEEYKQGQENTRQSSQQDWADTRQQSQQDFEKSLESTKDTHSKQRIAQQLGGEMALENRKIEGQMQVADYKKNSEREDGSVSWKGLSDTSSTEIKDWSDQYKRQVERLTKMNTGSGNDANDMRNWLEKNPRPVRVPESAARYIASKVNSRIKDRPDLAPQASQAAAELVDKYKKLMLQRGMTNERALMQLIPAGF